MIDDYSNFTMLCPQKTKADRETVKNVQPYIRIFDPPRIIQSDNGAEFKNKMMKDLLEKYNIKEVNNSSRHPQCNGKVERMNRLVKETITSYHNIEPKVYWINFIERTIERINSSKCRRTRCKARSLFFISVNEIMKQNPKFKLEGIEEEDYDDDNDDELDELYFDYEDKEEIDNNEMKKQVCNS